MTKGQITHEQATALAALIHTIRSDWDTAGVLAQLGKARDMGTAGELALAAVRAAGDPKNRTPAVIALDGPHWRDPEPTAPKAPRLSREERRAKTCATCGALDGCYPPAHEFIPLDHAKAGRTPQGSERVRAALKQDRTCPTHSGEWADACRGCAIDSKVGNA